MCFRTFSVCSESVRLVGQSLVPRAGILELHYLGIWGSICYSYYFDNNDAKVACYMLGFGYLVVILLPFCMPDKYIYSCPAKTNTVYILKCYSYFDYLIS